MELMDLLFLLVYVLDQASLWIEKAGYSRDEGTCVPLVRDCADRAGSQRRRRTGSPVFTAAAREKRLFVCLDGHSYWMDWQI